MPAPQAHRPVDNGVADFLHAHSSEASPAPSDFGDADYLKEYSEFPSIWNNQGAPLAYTFSGIRSFALRATEMVFQDAIESYKRHLGIPAGQETADALFEALCGVGKQEFLRRYPILAPGHGSEFDATSEGSESEQSTTHSTPAEFDDALVEPDPRGHGSEFDATSEGSESEQSTTHGNPAEFGDALIQPDPASETPTIVGVPHYGDSSDAYVWAAPVPGERTPVVSSDEESTSPDSPVDSIEVPLNGEHPQYMEAAQAGPPVSLSPETYEEDYHRQPHGIAEPGFIPRGDTPIPLDQGYAAYGTYNQAPVAGPRQQYYPDYSGLMNVSRDQYDQILLHNRVGYGPPNYYWPPAPPGHIFHGPVQQAMVPAPYQPAYPQFTQPFGTTGRVGLAPPRVPAYYQAPVVQNDAYEPGKRLQEDIYYGPNKRVRTGW